VDLTDPEVEVRVGEVEVPHRSSLADSDYVTDPHEGQIVP